MTSTFTSHVTGAASIHDKIGRDIDGFGGILKCTVCERWEWITTTAVLLRSGWPTCCKDLSMTWITRSQLDDMGWVLPAARHD